MCVKSKDLLNEAFEASKSVNLTNNNYFSKNLIKRYIFRKNLHKVIKLANNSVEKEKALDFGPGFGILLGPLSKIYDKVVAVDIDSNQIGAAQLLVKKMDLHNVVLELQDQSDELLNFPENEFDCIIADNVLEHISDIDTILLRLFRILKKGGLFIVSLPSENWIYRMFESPNDGHVVRSAKGINSLFKKIENMGFKITSTSVYPIYKIGVFSKK